MDKQKETFGFQTEVGKLLDLMIRSIYSNKEIFLRELISNASDASDKRKFRALEQPEMMGNEEMNITITFDKEAKTLTVSDHGIGMDRDEIIEHLGTIAKSGTEQFLNQLTGDQVRDSQLIGQFGVGFYSSFMVADKVEVTSRKAGIEADEAVKWTSTGGEQFSVEGVVKSTVGTDVTLHLKEEELEFCDGWKIRGIVKKYSDHIALPIMMEKEKTESSENTEEGETATSDAPEFEQVNDAKALWTRSKSDISDEDYQAFYKTLSFDFQEPLAWTHNRVEGNQDYTSLLFIPSQAPFDLFDRDNKHGLKLYIQRVFIMENADMMPAYLRFIKGVIDSNDLPLNISREILQSNRVVERIKTASVKKVLSLLSKMAKNKPEDYSKFWKAFGNVLKEGVGEDMNNKEALAELYRFSSTHTDSAEQTVSFDEYIGRMKEDQKHIYYITAESFSAAVSNPHLEIFRKKGIEVLLLPDRVDEWMISHLTEVQGKSLQSVSKGDLSEDVAEEEKTQQEEVAKDFEAVLTQMKEVLGGQVKEVRVTHRLTDSPSCVVAPEDAMSMNLQRMMEAAGQAMPKTAPILELNPEHGLVTGLKDEQDDDRFAEWAHFLLEQAMLAEAGQLEDPASFVKRVNRLLA